MKKLKIGLAGLGTVGKGVYDILTKDAEILRQRSGTDIELTAVSSRSKKTFINEKIKFYPNLLDLANDPEIDVIIEVIGGTTDAKNLFAAAIKNGKKFISANKALIAEDGLAMAKLLENAGSYLGFEASVAGATPIIKIFKEGLAANEIKEFYAILNGTCNFILTKMESENLDFSLALKQAQELGYAEADPTADIEGIDTAHKLTILAAIAGGAKPALKQLHIEGIDKISIDDIRLAADLGYKIKLLAVYKNSDGASQQAVYPALISTTEKISQVDSAFNAIVTNASNAGSSMVIGSGAGSLPTASAVVSDLVDLATNRHSFLFGVKSNDLRDVKITDLANRCGQYFLSLVVDKNLAQKTNLGEVISRGKISIEKVAFIDRDQEILCGFLTAVQKERDVVETLKQADPRLVKSAKFIRVEKTGF